MNSEFIEKLVDIYLFILYCNISINIWYTYYNIIIFIIMENVFVNVFLF